jgi:hypothetical protein
MLAPVKPLFFGGCNDRTVHYERRGRVVKNSIDAENDHVRVQTLEKRFSSARIVSEKRNFKLNR